jgi:hypothetical protein
MTPDDIGLVASPPRPARSALQILGIVLAVALAVAGLVAITLLVLFVIAMSQYGSNK